MLEKGRGDWCRYFLYKSRKGLRNKRYLSAALSRPPMLSSCRAYQDVRLAGLLYQPAISANFVDCGACSLFMSQCKLVVC